MAKTSTTTPSKQDPSYEFRDPQQMTRPELVRAIEEWQGNEDLRLDVIVDLLEAARARLAEETYTDGVGLTRCCLCLSPVKE